MGRRKIEMKMVSDNNSRQVTFSKRRTGLFKKANELATMCGAEVAIVVFSPGGKPFSFGHPDVDSIANRFQNHQDHYSSSSSSKLVNKFQINSGVGSSNSRNVRVEKLNQQLNELLKQLQAEKKRGELIDKEIEKSKSGFLKLKAINPSSNIDELNMRELQKLKKSLEELKEKVNVKTSEIEASSSLLLLSKKQLAVQRNKFVEN